jgi:hypothetical protein
MRVLAVQPVSSGTLTTAGRLGTRHAIAPVQVRSAGSAAGRSTRYADLTGTTFVVPTAIRLIRNRVELSDAEVALGRLALATPWRASAELTPPGPVPEWRLDSVPHAVRQLLAEVEERAGVPDGGVGPPTRR